MKDTLLPPVFSDGRALPPWTMRQRILCAALTVAVTFGIGVFVFGPPPEGPDFFYGVGRLSGSDLYVWDKQVEAMRDYAVLPKVFPRPPFIAVLLKPFTTLPYASALIAWQIVNACALFGFVLLTATTQADTLKIAAFAPLFVATSLAQDTPILLFVLAFGMTLMRKGRDYAGGAVLAFLSEKPHLVTLLPLAIMRRRRAFAGLVAVGIALYCGSAMWAGWDWPLRMAHASRLWDARHVYRFPPANLYGLVSGIDNATMRWALWVAACITVLIATRIVSAGSESPQVRISAAVFASVAVGYRPLTYDSALVLPFLLAVNAPLWLCITIGLAGCMPVPPAQLVLFGLPLGWVLLQRDLGRADTGWLAQVNRRTVL